MVQLINDKKMPSSFKAKDNQIVLFDHQKKLYFNYRSSLSLKYLYSGSVKYQMEGKEVILKPGFLLLVREGYRIDTSISGPTRGISIFLPERRGIGFEEDFYERDWPLIHSPLKGLLESFKTGIPSTPIDTVQYINQVSKGLQQYQNLMKIYFHSLSYKKKGTKKDVLGRILMARLILEKKFHMEISLDELAKMTGLSKFLLVRKFKETFEISPRQFLLEKRIELAKQLILRSDKSFTQISNQCGFSNLHHFSKTFKKHTNYSPSDYKFKLYKKAG